MELVFVFCLQVRLYVGIYWFLIILLQVYSKGRYGSRHGVCYMGSI